MKDIDRIDSSILFEYQANKLQQLVADLHNCCKDRVMLESQMFDLPTSELRCLMLFDGHKYLTGAEIADMMEITKSRATVIVQHLENKDMVQRASDPNDARIKIVSLTLNGQKKVREIEDFTFHIHQQLLGIVEPEKREVIIDALESLKSSMDLMKEKIVPQG